MEMDASTTLSIIGGVGTLTGIIGTIGASFFKLGRLANRVDTSDKEILALKNRQQTIETRQSASDLVLARIDERSKQIKEGQEVLFQKIDKLVDGCNKNGSC